MSSQVMMRASRGVSLLRMGKQGQMAAWNSTWSRARLPALSSSKLLLSPINPGHENAQQKRFKAHEIPERLKHIPEAEKPLVQLTFTLQLRSSCFDSVLAFFFNTVFRHG